MKNVLLILSSPRGWQSHSHQIARRIVDDLKSRWGDASVVVRDLGRQPVPHINGAFAMGRAAAPDKMGPEEKQALALSDLLIAELKAADVVVLAAPMHNFGIPSCLKAWIDHVVRPGITFTYAGQGPKGLVTGKKAVLVVARGGVYSEGPMKEYDFQEPYLRAALGFIGITDVDVIRIEGIGLGPEALQKAMRSARSSAAETVRDLTYADTLETLSAAA